MQITANVLAIYSGENKDLWNNTKENFPRSWTVGYEPGEIDEKDLYILRALPSFYLIDKNKKIILKDASLNKILQELKLVS